MVTGNILRLTKRSGRTGGKIAAAKDGRTGGNIRAFGSLWNLYGHAIAIAALCVLTTGCLKQNFKEDKAVLTVDTDAVAVDAAPAADETGIKKSLKIRCNRSWRAEFVGESGETELPDWVTMDKDLYPNLSDASYDSYLTMNFTENLNKSERKTVLRISTKDMSADVIVSQNGAEPYIKIDRGSSPSSISGGTTGCAISFKTNSDWTAEITDSNFPEIKLSQTEGDYSGDKIEISFTRNTDGRERRATVVLKVKDSATDGKEITDSFTLVQNSGLEIILDLTTDKPFENIDLPTASASAVTVETAGTFGYGGESYEVLICPSAGKGAYHGGKSGQHYLIFTGPGSISTPAIDNYRLSSLTVTAASASNRNFSVTSDPEGTSVLKGGEKVSIAAGEHTWQIENAPVGVSCYLYCGTANPRIQKIGFFYE